MNSLRFAGFLLVFCASTAVSPLARCQDDSKSADSKSEVELKSLKQKASYMIGFDIGEDVLRRELDVDYQILIKGFLDAVNKRNPPLSKTEIESVMKAFEKQVKAKANEKWKELSRTNLEQGAKFLSKNKLAEGVIQLETGVQYKILNRAKGDKPKNGDRIKIKLFAKHLDGKVFEDTRNAEKPVEVVVGATLRGLDAAFRRMSVGETWQVVIPADQAFGQRGSPPTIGPNETLIYEVELIEIMKK